MCEGGKDKKTRRNNPGDRGKRLCPSRAHALLDFSLQIQAVTLTYMAILGAGVAQACDPRERSRSAPITQFEGSQSMNVGFRIPTRAEIEPAARGFDVRVYLNFVWRHWMFIGSVAALALLIAVVYLVRATPSYTATTQVLLEEAEKAPTDTGPQIYRFNDRSYIENQFAILRSDPLLRRVVIKERLGQPVSTAKASEQLRTKIRKRRKSRLIRDGINQLRGALSVSRSGQAQSEYFHHLERTERGPRSSPTRWQMPMLLTSSTLVMIRPKGPRVG